MKFHLDFSFESNLKFKIEDHFFLIGSCFSQNIGSYFKNHLFHHTLNPFGILYEPFSIARALDFVIENKSIDKTELIMNSGIWHSPYHHGIFSSEEPDDILRKIGLEMRNAHHRLKNTNLLVITFGSAYGWRDLESGKIFANCHKIPGNQFEKVFFDSEEVLKIWDPIIDKIFNFNPHIKIIFAISPVRYIRDGLINNSKSKASLITSVHRLCKGENVQYFPSYEILMDVLRDYRFYAEDMVHPNGQALNYIWNIFKTGFFDNDAIQQMNEISEYDKFKRHRPLKLEQIHLEKLVEKRKLLMIKYPELDWESDEMI